MKNPFGGDLNDGVETGASISEINSKFIIESQLQDRFIKQSKFLSFLNFTLVILIFAIAGLFIFGAVHKATQLVKKDIVEVSN